MDTEEQVVGDEGFRVPQTPGSMYGGSRNIMNQTLNNKLITNYPALLMYSDPNHFTKQRQQLTEHHETKQDKSKEFKRPSSKQVIPLESKDQIKKENSGGTSESSYQVNDS